MLRRDTWDACVDFAEQKTQGEEHLKCPTCNSWTTVEQTKNTGSFVERRRKCANEHTFTTAEQVMPPKKRGRPFKDRTPKDASF